MKITIVILALLFSSGCVFNSSGLVASEEDAARVDGGEQDAAVPITCGDGILDPGEQCDIFAFGGFNCHDLGFDMGSMYCEPDCTANHDGCRYLPE